MPEGDTVFRAARTLHRALAGRILLETDFRVPRLANADLAGQLVNEVVPRGKHLLTRTDAGLTLRTHFKMEGAWVLYRQGDRWRGPSHDIRVVLKTDEYAAVGYLLAMVDIVSTKEEQVLLGHLGPDILGPDWDLEEAVGRIRRRPGVSIAEALLDQTNVAGIGNLYKNESLFLSGVDPRASVREVADLHQLLALAQRLMRMNTEHAVQATTGDSRKGRQWWVMERPGKPCYQCGSPIQMQNHGTPARLSYWCPQCQKR